MSLLDTILAKVKEAGIDPARKEAIDKFTQALSEAKSSKIGFVNDNAKLLSEWLEAVASDDLDLDSFNHLVEAQKRTMEQKINTLNIKAQVMAKKLSVELLALGVTSVAPVVPPAAVKAILK